MPDWSIRIVPVHPAQPAGSAEFVPQNGSAGQPLATWDGDLVTWSNTTDAAHWPWPTNSNYNPLPVAPGTTAYMSDEIPARLGSRPTYSVNLNGATPPLTIYYYCKDHPNDPNERGTIVITSPP